MCNKRCSNVKSYPNRKKKTFYLYLMTLRKHSPRLLKALNVKGIILKHGRKYLYESEWWGYLCHVWSSSSRLVWPLAKTIHTGKTRVSLERVKRDYPRMWIQEGMSQARGSKGYCKHYATRTYFIKLKSKIEKNKCKIKVSYLLFWEYKSRLS